MKKITLSILYLMLLIPLLSQETYIPLVDLNKRWNVREYEWDFENGNPNYGWLTHIKTYGERFSGDTLVDGRNYKFLEFCYSDSLFQNWIKSIYLFREDTSEKKVYVNWYGNDVLLYDYSVEVGDTVSINLDFSVDSIEYHFFANKERKFIYLSSMDVKGLFVEGLGCLENMLAPYFWGTIGNDKHYELQCFYINSSLDYQRDSTCYNKIDYTSINRRSNENKLSIYPNPASNVIRISSNSELKNCSINIYNTQGRELLNFPGMTIPAVIKISDLDSGLYLLTVQDLDRRVYSIKFLVN